MLMRKRRIVTVAADLFLTTSASFLFWSVLWWVADWFRHGFGFGRSMNILGVTAICLPLGYNIHRIGWQFGLAVILPAAVIVATQVSVGAAIWSVLVPALIAWVVKAEERDAESNKGE